MAIYEYIHPKTGEVFEDIRPYKKADMPFVAPDGVKCKRVAISSSFCGWKGNKEVFEMDRDYVKKMKPKYIRFKDGHRERYDPRKH